MRTSDELVTDLHQRMKARRQTKARRKYYRICASAAAACLAVAVLLAVAVAYHPAVGSGTTSGIITASVFAGHPVPGYIVVALAAFCLGSLATSLCHKLKTRLDGGENSHDR